jgi:hypothetical protein
VAPWNAATPADTLRVAAAGVLPDLAELAPGAPPDLLAVIGRGLSPDPHERGSAAAFALDLRHACRPEPVRLPVPGVRDEDLGRTGRGPRTELTHQLPGRHRRDLQEGDPAGRRLGERIGAAATPLRRVGAITAMVAVLAGVGWLGGRWGDPPAAARSPVAEPAGRAASAPGTTAAVDEARSPSAGRQEQPTDPAVEWTARLAELYERRAEALASGAPDLLDDVYAVESPLLAADRDTLSDLAAAGETLRGFAPAVVRVEVAGEEVTGGRVTLDVVDTWPVYDVVAVTAPDGPALRSVPARGEAEVRMTLVETNRGWLLEGAERVR